MITSAPTKEIEFTILKKAGRLFAENGYQATSLQTIADAVGMRKSALWYYFPSKELILFNILREAGAGSAQRLERILDSDAKPLEKLHLALNLHLSHLSEIPDARKVSLFEFRNLSREHQQDILAWRNRYIDILSAMVEEAIGERELRPMNPKLLALAIMGMINWIHQWYGLGEHSVEEMASFFWDLIYEGVHSTNLRVKRPSLDSGVRAG